MPPTSAHQQWHCLDWGRVPRAILNLPAKERTAALLSIVQTAPASARPPDSFFQQVPMSAREEALVVGSFAAVGVALISIPALALWLALAGYYAGLATLGCIVAALVLHPLPMVEALHSSFFMRCLFRYFSFTCVWRGPRDLVRHSATTAPWIGYGVPHGVFPFGNVLCVAAINLLGIPFVGTSADVVFRVPLLRCLTMLGVVSAGKTSVVSHLHRGINVGLVPDGIAGIFKQTARKEMVAVATRRGAARLALEHNFTIHPGYLLGNTACYHVWHDSTGVLERLSRALRVSLMIFWGRWGLPVPFRTPISFVFGNPVKPMAADGATAGTPPSRDAVEALHQEVLAEVRRIYEEAAPPFGWAKRPIVFV